MEKKVFEEPKVTKVEIDFNDRVIAAGCSFMNQSCYPIVDYS